MPKQASENQTTKHTPGPWHTGTGPMKGEWIIYGPIGYAVGNAVVYHGKMSTDEVTANARLIAAAPELLEAARQALGDLEWVEQKNSRTNLQSSILLLRATIARAEGRERA